MLEGYPVQIFILSLFLLFLYLLELTVGFETNLNINAHRKTEKCHQLLQTLSCQFSLVKFVNLSVSCLGMFGCSADSFIDMCKDLLQR